MSNQHYALNAVCGEESSGSTTTSWHIEDGILHVIHKRPGEYDDVLENLHFRLVQIEQQWVEVTPS